MAFTVAHGILGIEAIHRLANQVDLNTQSGLPRIEVDRITGLHALPDADDNREATYAWSGEQVYPSLNRGKTITYEGRILGADIYQLRALTHTLRHAAAAGRLYETSIIASPHAAVGGSVYGYQARVLALEVDDAQTGGYEQIPTAYQRSFVLTVRQSDPRYYLQGADVTAGGASGAVVTVTNPGTADALPVWIVNGPIPDDLVFERYDNFVPRKLLYDSIALAAGQQLRLDFNTRTLKRVSDGASFEHHRVFDDSDWWDATAAGLNPGITQIRCAGGGTWSCTFSPASW